MNKGLSSLNGVTAIRYYIDRIINGDDKCKGMKVLILDAATTQIVSSVYSQTEILNKQVYLVTTLDKLHNFDKSQHMKAICFIRPTPSNVDIISMEISNKPKYIEYHIFFSSTLSSGLLRKLAESDIQYQLIQQVQEYYADFLPINEDLFTLQCRNTLAMTVSAGTSWAPKHAVQYERNIQGIQSMLLALKRRPYSIRYAAHSPCAEELAKDLHDSIIQDDIYHFHRRKDRGGLLLLILDRRDDPVTPLLGQWTYQAMVHELLGLNNHRVILKDAPNISKDLEEVVLSAASDEFFANNRHKNFGELGEEIQRLLHDYQKQTAQHTTENLNSIEAMQQFMDKFPELRTRSHTVSKHVAIMGELSRIVETCNLMDVSQFEQTLACQDDHTAHWRELLEKLNSSTIKIPDKLRLGLLYALRYENSANMHMVQQAMTKGGVPPAMVKLVPVMLRYGGSKSRSPGLFGNDSHNIMSRMTKNFVGAVQGIDNVYTQHIPLVMDTIQSIIKGKLSIRDYPIVHGSSINNNNDPASIIPDEILIFMVGGITYEEGTKISEFNKQQQQSNKQYHRNNIQVVLAGSTIHNSTSFLEELKATALG